MDSSPQKRPWFQLHLITCVGLMLIAAALVGVNVVWQSPDSSHRAQFSIVYRGWPYYWTFQPSYQDNPEDTLVKLKARLADATKKLQEVFDQELSAFERKADSGELSIQELKSEQKLFQVKIASLQKEFNERVSRNLVRFSYYREVDASIGSGYWKLTYNAVVGFLILAVSAVFFEWLFRRRQRRPIAPEG